MNELNELEALRILAGPLLEELRMLADWQLRTLGYDPQIVTALIRAKDEREQALSTRKLRERITQ